MSQSKLRVVVCGIRGLGGKVILALLNSDKFEVLYCVLHNDEQIGTAAALGGKHCFNVINTDRHKAVLRRMLNEYGFFVVIDLLGGEGCQGRTLTYEGLKLPHVIATNSPKTAWIGGMGLVTSETVPLNSSPNRCIQAIKSVADKHFAKLQVAA